MFFSANLLASIEETKSNINKEKHASKTQIYHNIKIHNTHKKLTQVGRLLQPMAWKRRGSILKRQETDKRSKQERQLLLLLLQPFYDLLSGTTQVSRYLKDKPFWTLLKQT